MITFAFIHPPYPDRVASAGIDGDNRAPVASREIENAIHEDRRRFILEFRGAEVVGFPCPRDFQLFDVVASDLIERGLTGAGFFAAEGSPFSVLRPGLGDQRNRTKQDSAHESG